MKFYLDNIETHTSNENGVKYYTLTYICSIKNLKYVYESKGPLSELKPELIIPIVETTEK